MTDSFMNAKTDMRIWWRAFGYVSFYIPYSALVKALSSGKLESLGWVREGLGGNSAFEFMPAVLIGTVLTMPVIMFCLGWYRDMGRFRIVGFNVVCASPWAMGSGIAFAVIIATTTIAYTFHGVSIVLALLLMRVLILSPLTDKLFNGPVHVYSWAG